MVVLCFILMIGAIIASGALGIYCDVFKRIKAPQLYWVIGMIGGVIAGAFAILTIWAA